MWGIGACAVGTWWVCLLVGLLFVAVMIAGCFLLMRVMMRGGMCGHGGHAVRDAGEGRRPG
jgi:hypothetical protein